MSIKDIFSDKTDKIISVDQLQSLYKEAESEGFLEQKTIENERYFPTVDFSNPANFAKYGSAQKYYVDAITNIYQSYPYDGSAKEKQEWRNNSSELDLYIFDNVYPKTVGFINLASGSTITTTGSFPFVYRKMDQVKYVAIEGGPNASGVSYEKSNIYDPSKNRESNLAVTEDGNTVEFWFKDPLTSPTFQNTRYCLFDLKNDNGTRLTIKRSSAGVNKTFYVTYKSDASNGVTDSAIDCSDIDTTQWHHYAFVLKNNSSTSIKIEIYLDGNFYKSSVVSCTPLQNANNLGTMAYIGSLYDESQPSAGFYDEFRFWKTARTAQQIYRFWNTEIHGGTNTDDANTDLGVYYKFNEGKLSGTSLNTVDSICLDSSGRISNGIIVNCSKETKVTLSAIDEYYGKEIEPKNPILYSSNPLILSILEEYSEIGFLYDQQNSTNIYNSLPAWITEEAEKIGNEELITLVQIISSYFDTLHLQIESLSTLNEPKYLTETEKPKPFIKTMLSSYGFEADSIFNDSTFLEEMLSRNEEYKFDKSLLDIKNTIYQNIYNSLSYIYKAKGTEKAFRNFIRCFGVDEELIKINVYGNNIEYNLQDNYKLISTKKKVIDFNEADRFKGTVIQSSVGYSGSNIRGYIKGNTSSKLNYVPITSECEIVFPKKLDQDNPAFESTPFTEVSIFGAHSAYDLATNLNWSGSDDFNFQVYAIKREKDSKDAYFKLISNGFGTSINLTSSYYNNIYDNKKWNLSIRIKPQKEYNSLISGSDTTDYILEFNGFSTYSDTVEESFSLTSSISKVAAQTALSKNKRFYVGSHYQNFDVSTGSPLTFTDLKISNLRVWLDYLSDNELKLHSYDTLNIGRELPLLNVFSNNNNFDGLEVKPSETLALNWDFSQVTGSDTNGAFFVEDASSGSVSSVWYKDIVSMRHIGSGSQVYQNDEQLVNFEYFQTAKQQNIENLYDSSMVSIIDTDDVTRTKENKFVNYYFAAEKSMYQIIDEEILKWFATINTFNNAVGQPSERYRKEYKQLEHLREVYFKNVQNTPDFERFLEFYKWLDSSISKMIENLVPASANFSSNLKNMVESHILERNKYENKLPTIEFKDAITSTVANGRDYNYQDQRAPASPAGVEWLKRRVERTNVLVNTPSEPQNDICREFIRQVINSKNNFKTPKLYDATSQTFYEGKSDILRFFSKTYDLKANFAINQSATISSVVKTNNTQFNGEPQTKLPSRLDQVIQPVKKQGNYLNTYEVVQLSGRTNNNKSFVNLEGNVSGTVASSLFTGVVERSLPIRKKIKTIFVERFSAPGGVEASGRGVLNRESEEFSPYNTVNYRNLKVRKYLTSWESETGSIDSENPSLHKVNKNNSYRLDENGNQKTVHDNANIITQIPRSDSQYSWISKSATKKPNTSGYALPYDNINNYNTSSFELTSGSLFDGTIVDHIGLNTIPNLVKDIFEETNTVSPKDNIGTDINKYLVNNGSKFGTSTWKQIRVGTSKLVQKAKKLNKIIAQNIPVQKTRINLDKLTGRQFLESYVDKKETSFTTYIEPPVTYNKPMNHVVLVSGSKNPIELTTTYDNNKEKFANTDLAKRLGVKDRNEPQVHDILVNLEEQGLYEPKPEIEKISYSQVLYPEDTKVGLNIIRSKPNYAEEAGTGSNGYDRNIATIATVWRDNIDDRKRTNAINSLSKTGSVNSLNYAQISSSYYKTQKTFNYYPVKSGSYEYSGSMLYRKNAQQDSINVLDNHKTGSVLSQIFYIGNKIFTSDSYQVNSSSVIGELSPDDLLTMTKLVMKQSGTYIPVAEKDLFEEVKFKYDNLFERIIPKPQYSFYNHYPLGFIGNSGSTDSLILGPFHAEININNGFKFDLTNQLIGFNSWYDNYDKYFEELRPLSKNYSTLPEYKISDFMEFYIINNKGNFNNISINNYLSYRGSNDDVNQKTNNFNISFINYENENKISLKIDAIKKLLPYKGFYPAERTIQLANLFQKSLFDLTTDQILNDNFAVANGFDTQNSYGCPLDQQILTIMQPYFAPGIMYNTIKSGIAVDWAAIVVTSSELPYSASSNQILTLYTTGSTFSINNKYLNLILDKEQNFRFPFESLLDPTDIPDEIKQKNLIYLNPSLYGSDLFSGSERNDLVVPSYQFKHLSNNSINKRTVFKNNLYRLAINNFLAEIPNFFLKNGTLNSFESEPQNKIQATIPGKTYYMDVFLRKDKNFKQILAYNTKDLQILNTSNYIYEDSTFGPRTRFFKFSALSDIFPFYGFYNLKTAFAPYTPPYELGQSTARISFVASSSTTTINQIFSNAKIEYTNTEADQLFNSSSWILNIGEGYESSPAYKQMMKITSSINLFNKTFEGSLTHDQYGKPIQVTENLDSSKLKWSIQTKFETPILNFNNSNNYINSKDNEYNYYYSGLWAGSGSIPNSGEGVQFGIRESYTIDNNLTGSLIKLCGFSPSVKDIGVLNSEKEISEMVVLIPYIEKGEGNFENNDFAKNINGIIGEGPTNNFNKSDGPFYFSINKETINTLLETDFDSTTTYQISKIINSSNKFNSNSIAKQIKAMTDYNFPPHLDWVTNKNVNPFIMYTFEFKHTLDKEDLSLIWQNVMPKIARNIELESVTFDHNLGENEFFHGKKLPQNIKFKVFKVKKKAKISYYSLVNDIASDSRFKFDFKGGQTVPDYSYNYPYDFFSLVELVNVESTTKSSKPDPITTKQETITARERQQNRVEARKNKKIGSKFE
jgi:hypothetical protein